MTKRKEDIPRSDDNFYNFVKNLIGILEEETEVNGNKKPKWEVWLVPNDAFKAFKENWMGYEPLYHNAQAKTNRSAADVARHRLWRKEKLEPATRQLIRQYLRYETQIEEGEKVRMGLLVKDTEPSPVHGSHLGAGTPWVLLKNLSGGIVDVIFRREKDQTRPSILKGYVCELRYVLGAPLPPDPEDIPAKTTVISPKSHFQINVGIPNLGKTMEGYGRWRHKSNPALNSGWVQTMKINIS